MTHDISDPALTLNAEIQIALSMKVIDISFVEIHELTGIPIGELRTQHQRLTSDLKKLSRLPSPPTRRDELRFVKLAVRAGQAKGESNARDEFIRRLDALINATDVELLTEPRWVGRLKQSTQIRAAVARELSDLGAKVKLLEPSTEPLWVGNHLLRFPQGQLVFELEDEFRRITRASTSTEWAKLEQLRTSILEPKARETQHSFRLNLENAREEVHSLQTPTSESAGLLFRSVVGRLWGDASVLHDNQVADDAAGELEAVGAALEIRENALKELLASAPYKDDLAFFVRMFPKVDSSTVIENAIQYRLEEKFDHPDFLFERPVRLLAVDRTQVQRLRIIAGGPMLLNFDTLS